MHLVEKWLSTLERKIEEYSIEANEAYRVYISAEPASSAEYHIIPQVLISGVVLSCMHIPLAGSLTVFGLPYPGYP